jgi:N-acyl homoserine lactone hydrolase
VSLRRAARGHGVRRVVLLTLGWEDLPKSVSVHGAPPNQRLREPVPGVLLECDGGWLLLDTGFNPALIRDPALRRRFHGDPDFRPILPGPGEPLEEIAVVAVSHLHNDHAGGLRHFAGRVPVHAQAAELAFGLADHPVPEEHAIFRIDFDDPTIDWRLADGDTEIAPGVTALLTAGHTPGHQSFMVDLDESVGGGGLIFAFDAADLTENIEHELPIGGRVGVPPEATVEPIRRLKAVAAERGYQLVPGHDPVVWPSLTRSLAERFATTGPGGGLLATTPAGGAGQAGSPSEAR